MSVENPLSGVELANQPERDEQIDKKIDGIVALIGEKMAEVHPMVLDIFRDPKFFNSLSPEIKNDEAELKQFLTNTGKFWNVSGAERTKNDNKEDGLLGEMVQIGETTHHDGRKRGAESGYKINMDYLRSKGIDTGKVLFFRATQPSTNGMTKPEYYWTSDYFETRRGLNQEISPEQRKNAIILVADMDTIAKNGGLIQDINDDAGLAIRQIGAGNFDQELALARIRP